MKGATISNNSKFGIKLTQDPEETDVLESIDHMVGMPTHPTDWGPNVLSIPQFDPGLGTLNSVSLEFKGELEGESNVENTSTATSVSLDLQADITFAGPGFDLITLSPMVNRTVNLAAFDGVIDFGGQSGSSSGVLNAGDTVILTLDSFEAYVGLGSVDITADAFGTSNASGGGNLITQFLTNAGAQVCVTYGYTIPGPSTDTGTLQFKDVTFDNNADGDMDLDGVVIVP